MESETKEIELVRVRASRMTEVSQSIVVDSEGTMLAAGETLREIKATAKAVKERKEQITKPMNEALKSARAIFAPIEAMCDDAQTLVSRKMLRWQNDVELAAQKAEAAAKKKVDDANEKVQRGEMTENAARKLENKLDDKLAAMPEAVRSSTDFHTRENRKFRVLDESIIPREFFVLDEVKVRRTMMADIAIPGIEYYKEKTLV